MNDLLLHVLTMPMDELRARLSIWREICWMSEIRDEAKKAEILGDVEAVYPMKVEGNVIYPDAFIAGPGATKARDEDIRKMHAAGLPVSQIAREYGLSPGTVNKIIANDTRPCIASRLGHAEQPAPIVG
jgi:hypothetical protein